MASPSYPASEPAFDVAILGAGMAGCAAALWCRRLALRFTWLEAGDEIGGQLWRINGPIPDYPGLIAADGRAFRAALAAQLAELGLAPRLGAAVVGSDLAAGVLRLADGAVSARSLVLATGSAPRRLGVPGEAAGRGRGVSESANRDLADLRGRPAAVVGGGDAALENALLLAEACPHVVLVHRGAAFGRARPDFVAAVAAHPRIEVRLGAEVAEVLLADRVAGLRLAGGETLDVEAVVVKIGVAPATEAFAGQLAVDGQGYVVVDADQRTSVPGVYAAGDLCSPVHSSLAAAGGQAMIAVKALSRRLAGGAS